MPGQTVNVDLCYLPVMHVGPTKLPAVSGSSGHWVVERVLEVPSVPTRPGQVFGADNLDYHSAMTAYVGQTLDRLVPHPTPQVIQDAEPATWRTVQALQAARYTLRQQRVHEDQNWRAAKSQWRQTRANRKTLDPVAYTATASAWKQERQARQATLAHRKAENVAWHTPLAQARAVQAPPAAGSREWVAVAVIIDNCTRQCLGLPLFTAGAHLTSKELIAALRDVLPAELEFLISDQGTHFRATVFADFAHEREFTHVPVYRHRPESNGIAERFVRTLKAELRAAAWDNATALGPLLTAFQTEYNDRPHQGLPTPGISPNEFAKRVALF